MISAHARSSKGEDRWSSSEFVEGWLSDLSLICWIRSMMFLFLFWRLKKKNGNGDGRRRREWRRESGDFNFLKTKQRPGSDNSNLSF